MTTRTVDPFFSLFLIAEMVRFAFYAGKDICVCIAGSRMDIQIKVISTKKTRRALPSVCQNDSARVAMSRRADTQNERVQNLHEDDNALQPLN